MGGSPLFQGAQTWPGGVATSQVSGMSAPALPAAGGARGMDPFLASLLAKKQQQADEDRALQKQLQYRQLAALDSAGNKERSSLVAPTKKRALFVKMNSGLGVVPGYSQAQEGEPGAAFAGYALNDTPGGPSNSSFAPAFPTGTSGPTNERTPLDLNETEAQRRSLEHTQAMAGGGQGGSPAAQAFLAQGNAAAQMRALGGMAPGQYSSGAGR